jgi:hypothetical protein
MSEPEPFGDEYLNLRYMIRAKKVADAPDLRYRVTMLRGDDFDVVGPAAEQLAARLERPATLPAVPAEGGPIVPAVGESLDPETGESRQKVRRHVPGA